jgi:cytochrome c oxidase subunit 1
MWRGSVTFETPMLWALGFLATFLFGGVTGIMLATPTLDFQVSDSYFVVAHFHYTLTGTLVFVMYAGIYYWFPKISGKMLSEKLGKWHFWTTFVGFQSTFFGMHWIGMRNTPRRYADYMPEDGIQTFNQVATVGSLILGLSFLFLVINVVYTLAKAPKVDVDDPWGYGASLEWATSCPPPRHNFSKLPRIRSERPAFDLHHPEAAAPAAVAANLADLEKARRAAEKE